MAGWSKIPRDLELECLYVPPCLSFYKGAGDQVQVPIHLYDKPFIFIDKVNFTVTPNDAFFTRCSSSISMHGNLASYQLLSSIDFLLFLAYKHVQGFTCSKFREYHILPKLSSATWKVWNFFPYLYRKLLGCLLPPTSLLSIFKSWLCQTIFREWGILEHIVLNGVATSNPFPQVSGNSLEDAAERI